MAGPTARLDGYTRLLGALKDAPKAIEKELRAEFRAVGQILAGEWSKRFSKYSEKTAAGLKPYVRARGLEVDQTLQKTTGLRPDWGRRQMAVGLQALDDKTDDIIASADAAMQTAVETVGLMP
jgi:hypothetical protein